MWHKTIFIASDDEAKGEHHAIHSQKIIDVSLSFHVEKSTLMFCRLQECQSGKTPED